MTVTKRYEAKKWFLLFMWICRIQSAAGVRKDNAQLKVFECLECGLAFLSSLYHIREGFYEDSGMHAEITGDTDLESCLKIEKE